MTIKTPKGFVVERIYFPDTEKQLHALKILLEYKPSKENQSQQKSA